MSDKELCRAWITGGGFRWYCDVLGVPTMTSPDTRALHDGFTIVWPDGPGVAELVPIPYEPTALELVDRLLKFYRGDHEGRMVYGNELTRIRDAILAGRHGGPT